MRVSSPRARKPGNILPGHPRDAETHCRPFQARCFSLAAQGTSRSTHPLKILLLLFRQVQGKATQSVIIRRRGYVRSRPNRGGIDLGRKEGVPSHD
jgi:hypothetical protein